MDSELDVNTVSGTFFNESGGVEVACPLQPMVLTWALDVKHVLQVACPPQLENHPLALSQSNHGVRLGEHSKARDSVQCLRMIQGHLPAQEQQSRFGVHL